MYTGLYHPGSREVYTGLYHPGSREGGYAGYTHPGSREGGYAGNTPPWVCREYTTLGIYHPIYTLGTLPYTLYTWCCPLRVHWEHGAQWEGPGLKEEETPG